MFPGFSDSSIADRRGANSKANSQLLDRGWRGFAAFKSNDSDSIFGQFGQMLLFALGFAASLFLVHVVHVCFVVPQEEMRWADTSRVVAPMEHQAVFGYRPVFQFPRDPVGSENSELFLFFPGSRPDHPVPAVTAPTVPQPARGFHARKLGSLLVHSFPKPRSNRFPQFFLWASFAHNAFVAHG